ncbi:MAG: hypothetical protein R2750_08175 [Bacteroidales bacterium]
MQNENAINILFLHHSTGRVIWTGKPSGVDVIKNVFNNVYQVPDWFIEYNQTNGTNYAIKEQSFPNKEPYGWKNYPFDYYNIWVKNAGSELFMDEPTLEILTKNNDVIIFKHCFPVSKVDENTGIPDINSEEKRLENYKVQYNALKKKIHEFQDTKFIVWTSPVLLENHTNPDEAQRSKDFVNWVISEWDEPTDNIFIWDFNKLQTEGGLYLPVKNARNKSDSHPSESFAKEVAPLFCQRIVDVIENNGEKTYLTGIMK